MVRQRAKLIIEKEPRRSREILVAKLQGTGTLVPTPLAMGRRVDKGRVRTLVDFLIEGVMDGLFAWEHRAASLYLPAMKLTCVHMSGVKEELPCLSKERLQFVKHYMDEAGFHTMRKR